MINAIIQYEIRNDKLDNTPVAILQRKAVLATESAKRITKYIELLTRKLWLPGSNLSMQKEHGNAM